MVISNEQLKRKEGEICIDASQLRPGVHVRLPGSWLDHEFIKSSFIITDMEQVQKIAALNFPRIFCEIARCKVPPLPKKIEVSAPSAEEIAEKARHDELAAKLKTEKQERIRTIAALRERLDRTQTHYLESSRSITAAFKSFDFAAEESISQLTKVSENSTSVLLSDFDSAIALVAEKGRSDGFSAHALSVMSLALLLGKQAGLPAEALHALGVGALLHDIGKSQINNSILRNNERNKYEEAIYETHCRLGYENALRTGILSPPVLDSILHHHEHFDGSGFPDKLSGEAIQLGARIIAIANRFDNLTNPVDYRRAISPSEALSTMWVKEKKHFDSRLLELFVRAMGVYPPSSIVQLSDGRIGTVVVSASTEKLLCPQVMLYLPEIPRNEAVIIDLAKEPSVKIDRALRLQDRSDEELDYLLPRRKMSWSYTIG